MRQPLLRIVLIVLLIRTNVYGVIVTENVATHVVSPGELMFGVNLDGVVPLQIGGITGCHAGLISDRHLITTAHCFDIEIDNVIDFPPETEVTALFGLATGVETRSFFPADVRLVDDWWVNNGDLAIVTLADNAPAAAPRYSIYRGTSEIGTTVVVVGYGGTGTGDVGDTEFSEQMIAGLNRYEAIGEQLPPPSAQVVQGGTLVYDFDNRLAENNALSLLGIDSGTGVGTDEAKSTFGDSGAPTFWNGAIIGLTSFGHRPDQGDIDDELNSTFGELSYDTRVSRWADFITEATGGAATLVDDPTGEPGDFNSDGVLDATDANELIRQSLGRSADVRFDLNQDASVNRVDLQVWVRDLTGSWLGDANLDGQFNSADLLSVAATNHYESYLATLWHQGDWNADGRFTSADLISALADGGYEQGPRAGLAAVPEPESLVLMLLGLGCVMRSRHRQPSSALT